MKIVEQREDNSEVNMLYSIREFVNSLIPLIVSESKLLDCTNYHPIRRLHTNHGCFYLACVVLTLNGGV